MKNMIIAAIVLLFLASTSMAIMESQIGVTILQPKLAKYDPLPAEAGKYVNIYIQVDNIGTEPAKNARFELIPKFPLYFDGSDSPLREYGKIPGLGDISLQYKLKVDDGGLDGNTEISLKYRSDDNAIISIEKFNITIDNDPTNAELRPIFVSMKPVAYAFSKSTLTIDIANIAPGTAYYTVVEASSPAASIEKDTYFIGTLDADDFDSVDYVLEFKNVTPGVYPVNLKLIYKDKDFVEVIEEKQIDITVISTKEARALLDQPADPVVMIITIIIILVIIRYVVWPWVKRTHKVVKSFKDGRK